MTRARRLAILVGLLGALCLAGAIVGVAVVARTSEDGVTRTLGRELDGCDPTAEIPARRDCYVAAFQSTLGERDDAPQLIGVIDQYMNERGGDPLAACHEVMHAVGRGYAQRRGVTLGTLRDHLPRDPSMVCSAGFTHGMLTAMGPEVERLGPRRLSALCATEPSRMLSVSCVHGVGHAFMRTSASLTNGLARCGQMVARDVLDCAQGVFHDYWLAAFGRDEANPRLVTDRSPAGLCGAVPDRFVRGCWFRAGTQLAGAAEWLQSADDVIRECRIFRSVQRAGCVTGFASAAARHPRDQMAICAALPRGDQDDCVRGVLLAPFLRATVADRRALLDECAVLDPSAQRFCVSELARRMTVATDSDVRREVCPGLAHTQARAWCAEGTTRIEDTLDTFD